MATLQKFKLLATQCGVAQSPTRSPRTSPVVHLRRRKTTLRMLLTRSSSLRSRYQDPPLPPLPPPPMKSPNHQNKLVAAVKKRGTLKDLFGSSTAPFEGEEEGEQEKKGKGIREVIGFGGKCEVTEVYRMRVNGLGGERVGSPRPGWIGFRHRSLLRRAWRPMLLAIPETSDDDDDGDK